MRRVCCIALILLASAAATAQQGAATAQPDASAKTPQSSSASSSADIAAAKAAHKVWVNLDTGVYHRGGRWYGKTKNGKFMTVDDAKKAGYIAAKRD